MGFRLGCWGWIWVVIASLGLVLLLGMLWVRSTTDLDAERERAVALGLPMTWEALGIATRPNADRELVARAVAVAGRAKAYEGNDTYSLYRPLSPVPPALIAWQAAGGSGVDDDIDRLVGQLSGRPGFDVDAAGIARASAASDAEALVRLLPVWDQRSELRDHYQLRSAASAEDPARLAGLIAGLATSGQTSSLTGHFGSLRLAKLWIAHVLRHREHLPGESIANQAHELAGSLDAALVTGLACEPLRNDLLLRLPAERYFKALSVALPGLMLMSRSGMAVFHRLGRGGIATRAIDAPSTAGGSACQRPAPRSSRWPPTCRECRSGTSPANSSPPCWTRVAAQAAPAASARRWRMPSSWST